MKFCLRIVLLVFLVSGTLTQELDLGDALDDFGPTPPKPKVPEKPKTDTGDSELDLFDALGPDPTPKPDKPAVKPPPSGGGGELDLGDALGPDLNPKPDKPAVNPPPSGGGGGSISDSDLFDIAGGGGDYKPDGGRSGGGGHPVDSGPDPHGGADQPQEAGSGQIAGIVGAVGVALLGAASSYIAYQKKKLCFKLQGGGADPEMGKGRQGGQNDNQLFSNLLRTS